MVEKLKYNAVRYGDCSFGLRYLCALFVAAQVLY